MAEGKPPYADIHPMRVCINFVVTYIGNPCRAANNFSLLKGRISDQVSILVGQSGRLF